jgi:hypothetical protein
VLELLATPPGEVAAIEGVVTFGSLIGGCLPISMQAIKHAENKYIIIDFMFFISAFQNLSKQLCQQMITV